MRGKSMADRAKIFAANIHSGQTRPNKAKESILCHLEEVANLVERSGGSDEEIAGAWLHDSVEDTDTKIDEIIELFGKKVGEIVDGMTDPPEFHGLLILTRKTLQARRVVSKSNSVKRVKLADQISNVCSVVLDPPIKWNKQKCADYVRGAKRIADQCCGISEFLDKKFEILYKNAMFTIENFDKVFGDEKQ